MEAIDKQRRDLLVKALTSGFYAVTAAGVALPVWSMGKLPGPLPPGKSIYELSGRVTIDGKTANLDTIITASSTIETSDNSKIIFAVGKDAFILRDNSKLEMQGSDLLIHGLRLVTGKLLSVFGKRTARQKLRMNTAVATIGIRGTGAYLETEPEQTYICTCYGITELASKTDPLSEEIIKTTHHDTPRYIIANAPAGKKIQEAPVINHTDDELDLIEALVGRTTPFIPSEY
jgi:hypothetical protein